MPLQINYGNPYSPAAGAATADRAREETDFARSMANNQVKLQERQLELQDAQMVLNGNMAAAAEARAKRAELRQEEIDEEEARQWRVDREDRMAREREQRQQFDLVEDRLERHFNTTEARLSDQMAENRERAKRAEQNELGNAGGRRLRAGKPKDGEYVYRDVGGQLWAVPTAARQRLNEAVSRITTEQQLKGPSAQDKEQRMRTQQNLSAAIRNAVDLREQALRAAKDLDEKVAGVRGKATTLRGRKNLNTGQQRGLAAMEQELADMEKQKDALGVQGHANEVEILSYYQALYTLNPSLGRIVTPAALLAIDWGALEGAQIAGVRHLLANIVNPDPQASAAALQAWLGLVEKYAKR